MFFKHWFVCLQTVMLCGVSIFLVSCKDETTSGTSEEFSILGNIDLPTTDQLDVKFTSKAIVLGNDVSEFSGYVVNRMTNVTNEISDDVKAFIFTNDFNSNISVSQVRTMFRAYKSGASFVLIDPVTTDRTALVDTLRAAISQASEEGEDITMPTQMLARMLQFMEQSDGKVDGHAEAIAVNRNGTYVVRNLEERADQQSKNGVLQMINEKGDTIRKYCQQQDYVPNAYDYGKSADLLVSWMAKCADTKVNLFASSDSVDEELPVQKLTIQQYLGPTRALDSKMLYELNFQIYSLHKSDTNEDYYMVHLSPTYNNSQLDCTPRADGTWSSKWTMTDHSVTLDDGTVFEASENAWNGYQRVWYGPYFKGSGLNIELEPSGDTNEDISLKSSQPSGSVEAGITLNSGLNQTLTNVSATDKSFWGGTDSKTVVISQSYSHTDEGLICLKSGESGNVVEWILNSNYEPKVTSSNATPPVKFPSMAPSLTKHSVITTVNAAHNQVFPFQYNDLTEDMTFTFVVKNPKPYHTYNLKLKDMVRLGELCSRRIDYNPVEVITWAQSEQTIPLTQPVRTIDYEIECSDSTFMSRMEQPIKDRMHEAFNVNWYGNYPTFSVYGLTSEEAKANAKSVLVKFTKIIYVVANRYNIDDTLTFTLKEKSTGTALYKFMLRGRNIEA